MKFSLLVLLGPALVAAFLSPASTHVTLMDPQPRHPGDPQKNAPCGSGATEKRSANIN